MLLWQLSCQIRIAYRYVYTIYVYSAHSYVWLIGSQQQVSWFSLSSVYTEPLGAKLCVFHTTLGVPRYVVVDQTLILNITF